jgi:2-phosphoglycerate kinase
VLGRYIEDLAREHGIPVIYSHQLDRTIADVLETIVDAAVGEE